LIERLSGVLLYIVPVLVRCLCYDSTEAILLNRSALGI
jgi:hypothetical protein